MESAPLALAYTHARNAAQETRRSNPVAASEEHDLAAVEFAVAAQNTADKEALRVLKLLESHHRQLGQILKDAHSRPERSSTNQKTQYQNHDGPEEREKHKSGDAGIHPPRLARTGRDMSTSIASNLASARGIPNTRQKRTVPVSPLVSNEHADATFAQDWSDRRTQPANNSQSSSRPSWTPPEPVAAKPKLDVTQTDAPFQQFYSRFEGLISTLTAPLAFASLPLAQPNPKEANAKRSQSTQQSSKDRSSKPDPTPSDVDYSSMISSAALRAVRDNNPTLKPHESFYHVPTTGGTMSYADITAQAYIDRQVSRQEHKHTRNSSANSTDDFVDASSQILPDRLLGTANQPKYNGKTMEELQLENTVLKRTTNDMARRLLTFELNAQNSSAALAQSIRSLHLSPVTTPENSRGKIISVSGSGGGSKGNDNETRMAQKRITDLEEALQKYDRKYGKLKEENAKYKETLNKYKEKWEGLKAGAKARREQAGGGDRLRRTSSQATSVGQGVGEVKDGGDGRGNMTAE